MSDRPLLSRAFVRVILSLIAAVYVASIFQFARLTFPQSTNAMVDFDSFHLAGRMVWDGTIGQAYQATLFYKRQQELGQDLFMPWTYPPPFNLIVAPLGLLPLPIAYAIFIGPMLIAYILTLRHLAGTLLSFALAATSPALIIAVRCGQNGLLTATLLGLMCAAVLKGRASAGVPMGLMIIKPHLAVTTSLMVALQKQWRVLAVASATVLSMVALSIGLFGPQTWIAFLDAIREATDFLTESYYRLYRMVSVYAALKSLGLSPAVAFAGQIAVALAVLGLVSWAALSRLPRRDTLGLAVMAAPLITPYAYDYDLCLLGVGLALLGPTIQRLMARRAQVALLLLSVTSCGVGLLQCLLNAAMAKGEQIASAKLVSLGAWPLLLAVALVADMMWRAQRASSAIALAAPVTRSASA